MSRKGQVVIKDRDKNIFCYLFDQKVATQKIIFFRYFHGISKSTAVKRMQKLVNGKLIGKNSCIYKNKNTIYYFLLPLGFFQIEQDFTLDDNKAFYKSDSIFHDLELSEIRNRLEKCNMVELYYSENYLQNCSLEENKRRLLPLKRLNSDGVIKVKLQEGGFWAAIEYERRGKTVEKYIQKFTDYYLCPDITAVFYICENKKIENLILTVNKKFEADFDLKIYTIPKKDIHIVDKVLSFKNSKGDIFNLK